MIDKILGMIPAFEQGLLKQLEPPRVSFQRFPLLAVNFLRTQPKLPKDFTTESQRIEEFQNRSIKSRKNSHIQTPIKTPRVIDDPIRKGFVKGILKFGDDSFLSVFSVPLW